MIVDSVQEVVNEKLSLSDTGGWGVGWENGATVVRGSQQDRAAAVKMRLELAG
jgi:hypothetical protein